VFDVRANRWLLASRISLSALRGEAADGNRDASYVIVIGDTVVPVVSADPNLLALTFADSARAFQKT